MKNHDSCLLGVEQKGALISGVILDRFQSGVIASRAASIYFTDPQKNIQGGLSLTRNSFLDGLVPGVLSTTFLLGLGIDGGSKAVAE